MFTPRLQPCLHHVWRHVCTMFAYTPLHHAFRYVYTMLTDMFTKYLETCMNHVFRHDYTMLKNIVMQCLKKFYTEKIFINLFFEQNYDVLTKCMYEDIIEIYIHHLSRNVFQILIFYNLTHLCTNFVLVSTKWSFGIPP